jgi:hypothetical protein
LTAARRKAYFGQPWNFQLVAVAGDERLPWLELRFETDGAIVDGWSF